MFKKLPEVLGGELLLTHHPSPLKFCICNQVVFLQGFQVAPEVEGVLQETVLHQV